MKDLWTEIGRGGASFVATRLSLLARALAVDSSVRRPALEALLTLYWRPLYAYVRAQGSRNEEAKDLVQGYCAHFLEKQFLSKFDPKLGRFRFFLLGHLRGYLGDCRDRDRAKKRGGGRKGVPLEERLAGDEGGRSAEEAYDIEWARGLIHRAFDRWKAGLREADKAAWLPVAEAIERDGFGGLPSIAEIARRLGVTEAKVRHFLQGGKKALRTELLVEIRAGVASEADAEEELRDMKRLLAAVE